ncbi:unnamed protein product, partial [Polarella glacialis]
RPYYANRDTGESSWDPPNARPSRRTVVPPPSHTPEELRKLILKHSFDLVDKDQSNDLNKSEFGLLLRRMNPAMSPAAIAKTYRTVDANGDNKVTFEEWYEWLLEDAQHELASSLADGAASEGGVSATFRIWDKDGSGKMSRAELEQVLET